VNQLKREDDIVICTARLGDDILHKRVTTRTEFDEFKRHVRYFPLSWMARKYSGLVQQLRIEGLY
jgi:hypothetical protein